ncbi:MAG: hypothetical protein DMG02_01330 [Acidobacteria bacterium]|nr:MAG: hypothetical protein DMG02_01330 [Acidobacteriota bacterium]
MRVKCNACGGVYDDVLPDGLQYFHRCPPLSVAELKQAISDGRLQLPPAHQALVDAATSYDAANPPKPDQAPRLEQVLATFVVERKGARNENVVAPTARDQPAAIAAEGAGVTTLDASATPAVPVLRG